MSDAQTPSAPAEPAAPLSATDARGRKIVLRELDPGDTLDLLEAAGPASDTGGYMRYAMVIHSVESIDGVPVPRASSRQALKANAKTLGNDGMVAVTAVLFGPGALTGADADTAKN